MLKIERANAKPFKIRPWVLTLRYKEYNRDNQKTSDFSKLISTRCSEKLLFRYCSEILSEASALKSAFAKAANTKANKNGLTKKKNKKNKKNLKKSTIQVVFLPLWIANLQKDSENKSSHFYWKYLSLIFRDNIFVVLCGYHKTGEFHHHSIYLDIPNNDFTIQTTWRNFCYVRSRSSIDWKLPK